MRQLRQKVTLRKQFGLEFGIGRAFSPRVCDGAFLGRCPRLVWSGPSALCEWSECVVPRWAFGSWEDAGMD